MIRRGLITLLIASLAACGTAAAPSASEDAAIPSTATEATPEATSEPTAEPTPEPTPAPIDPAAFTLVASDLPDSYVFTLTNGSEITLDSEEADYGVASGRRADLVARGFVSGWSQSYQSGDQAVLLGSSAYVFDNAAGALAEQEAQAADLASCTPFDTGGTIGDASSATVCAGPRGDAGIIYFAQDSVVVTVLWSGIFFGESGPNLDLLTSLAGVLQARIAG